jgi:hypothetical protein
MNDHYYTRDPRSASRPAECTFTYRGNNLITARKRAAPINGAALLREQSSDEAQACAAVSVS